MKEQRHGWPMLDLSTGELILLAIGFAPVWIFLGVIALH